jgi:hypothetical protein
MKVAFTSVPRENIRTTEQHMIILFLLLDVAIKICLACFFIIQEQAEIKFSKYFHEYVFLKVDRCRTLTPCDRSVKCGSGSM